MGLTRLAAAAATALTLLAAPAAADDPPSWEVAPSAQTGEHDAGWLRAVCTVRGGTEARCHLRSPGGFSRSRLTLSHGGEVVAGTTTFTDEPVRRGGRGRFAARPVSGVLVECSHRGNRVDCAVSFAGRLDDVQVIEWSRGWNHGGVRWEDLP